MNRYLFKFVNRLKLRWKMLVLVLPLVVVPILVVGSVVGYISSRQAYLGITQTSKDDLDHMAAFTIDLLNSHYQQFEVYRQDKEETINQELATLAKFAYSLVDSQNHQRQAGKIDLKTAQAEARKALKQVNVGESGYIFAMTSKGDLVAHVAQEGENIYDAQDENGRYFIREMCTRALESDPDDIMYTFYPWRNAVLGDETPRRKVAAYKYFREWDWIVAASGYLDETYNDLDFEKRSLEDLRAKIKNKKVGRTGYIYCMDSEGNFTLHPEAEGKNLIDTQDSDGHYFLREMREKKEGWIRYPWQNPGDPAPRMKIVRYAYFPPWDWIVAVGSYEDEFYHEANQIKWRSFVSMLLITVFSSAVAVVLVILAAKVLTDPINHMIAVIRKVKQGRFEERMQVETGDELGELALIFNRMTDIIKRNKEMESTLAQQGKMASLGVLSSGVAHEINNPLGVILGYASYIEGKITPEDALYKYIHEIKRESKRCKKIVQDLLSYARTPKPSLELTDINELLGQIVDFAANHTDMHQVTLVREFASDLPRIPVDGDQLRQVAINLILNAGAAMPQGGKMVVATLLDQEGYVNLIFRDSGVGISEENLERIFEPFFTTKERGTGLGLAITKQIVDMHHGKINLESQPGVGTTVTIRLPVEREEY